MTAAWGGTKPKSAEARALDDTSSKQTFVNKDFVKNMAYLNNKTDVHAVFLKKLQSGVDSANENVIEQIQGLLGDLLLVFAGLEPTGIDLGDLKYIFQGIGAMFGINPSTPFPLNLFEAAGHFFGNFVAPLEQFTDLIFDAIFAWALDLGFDPEFLTAVGEFKDAIEGLADSFSGFFSRILGLFDIFGIFDGGFGGGIGNLMSEILDFFSDIVMPSLKSIFKVISGWTVPFVQALTGTINTLSRLINGIPIGHITNEKVNLLGEGGFPDDLSMETGDTWVWDGTKGRTTLGSAKVNANSAVRELESVDIPVSEGQELELSVWLQWASLFYTGTTPLQLRLNRYLNGLEVGRTLITGVTSPAISQPTWFEFSGNYTVGDDCDIVRMSLWVNNNASNGVINWDDAAVYKSKQTLPQSWIANLIPDILGVRQFINDVIDGIISAVRGIPFVGGNIAQLLMWLTGWKEETVVTDGKATAAKAGMEKTQEIVAAAATGADMPAPTTDLEIAVAEALSAQTATIVSQGAQIEAIKSQNNADYNSGVLGMDSFEYDAVNDLELTGNWDRFILEGVDPKIATDGHDAHAVGDGTTIYRFTGEGEHTLTDYQKVSVTIASKLVYPGFGDGRRPHQAAVCRMSDDGSRWVRAYFNNVHQLVVDYRNDASSGNLYVSGADSISPPGPGENLTIEPGVGAELRHFRIWRGNTPIQTVIDNNSLTYFGEDARGHGIGFRIHSGYGSGRYTQYTATDNIPVPVRGIGFRAFRSNGSGIGIGSSDSVLPANCLDTIDRMGAGMYWDSVNQCLTIEYEGWYMFGLQIEGGEIKGAMGIGSYRREALIYKEITGSPVVVSRFGESGIETTSGDSNTQIKMPVSTIGNGGLVMYAEAGSKWYPGESGQSHDIYGDPIGTRTWFSCALLNRSLS